MSRQSTMQTALICTTILVGAALLSQAGPLTPPPGPVGDTQASLQYKTLQQVEPRIPLSLASTPGDATCVFRIANSGSYYLTGNVTGAGHDNGIEIAASRVSLDLCGFTVERTSEGSGTGIKVTGFDCVITIRNGNCINWSTGIDAQNGSGTIQNVSVRGSADYGIRWGYGAVRDCLVQGIPPVSFGPSLGTGITTWSNSSVEGCMIGNHARGIVTASNSLVTRCCVENNREVGIDVGSWCIVTGCAVVGQILGDRVGIRCTGTGSRIEDNVCGRQGIGVRSTNERNLIVHNVLANNSAAMDVGLHDLAGPLISWDDMATNCNPNANYY